MRQIQEDAEEILREALKSASPAEAVKSAVSQIDWNGGKRIVVACGKAAWEMGKAAAEALGDTIDKGIIITKYHHAKGPIANFEIYEAAHPVPDERGFAATGRAIELVSGLTEKDTVLFLVSGGASALFENPLTDPAELQDITGQLLASGASITEINTIRKRLSGVKGGRFALLAAPARIYTVILSDILGNPPDMIASGPAYPDSTTKEDAFRIVAKYGIILSEKAKNCLKTETPKSLQNVTTFVTGSVEELCRSAEKTCRKLGYQTVFLTSTLCCEAREAGSFLGSIARDHQNTDRSTAFILGGETVVHLHGKGLGGRNQELVLSAVPFLGECRNTCLFSAGSDGTDGPTDAAGAIADEKTMRKITAAGIDVFESLSENDSYHALQKADALLITGPTGTNVNDLTVLLIRR